VVRVEEGRRPVAPDQPAAAAEYFLRQRLGPGQREVPLERLQRELAAVEARERLQAERAAAASGAAKSTGGLPGGVQGWVELGPGDIGGRTRALAIRPDRPETMFAGGVAGGIWRSDDGGLSWSVVDDLLINLAISVIVIDPERPSRMYAGTGEGFSGSSSFVRGLGVLASSDGGSSWHQLPGTVQGVPDGAFHYVNDLVLSPARSSTVYAATRTGVWRSLDSGTSWTLALANPARLEPAEIGSAPVSNGSGVGCTDLVVLPDHSPDVVLAAFGSGSADGLFRSADGGLTWDQVDVGGGSLQGRMEIAAAPSDGDVVYVCMAANTSGEVGRLVDVFRSTDGGLTFEPRIDPESVAGPWLLSNLLLAAGCISGEIYDQGWYDNVIVVDPVDPDIVWVGGIDLFRSDDGGRTFGITDYWFFDQIYGPSHPSYLHADQHALVFHPGYDGASNQILYVGNDGGLARTQNARAATSQEACAFSSLGDRPEIDWENLNTGYGVTQFYHGDAVAGTELYIGGCQDNGVNLVRSTSGYDAWEHVIGGDGGYVAIDPDDPSVIYAETQYFPAIVKSRDGGGTFSPASRGITDDDGLFITPFVMDPSNPQVLWTGGTRPWRTTNAAESWQLAGLGFGEGHEISAIAVAPGDSSVVYLGLATGGVARTTDGHGVFPSWTLTTDGLPAAFVSSIAVNPIDPDIAYCTTSTYGVPHVFETLDGGITWTPIDGIAQAGVPDIPVHCIVVRSCDPRQLYVGTELGVFVSKDRGTTWEPANLGLAHTVVEALDLKDERTLVAFTHGRGAFQTTLDACTATEVPRQPSRRVASGGLGSTLATRPEL